MRGRSSSVTKGTTLLESSLTLLETLHHDRYGDVSPKKGVMRRPRRNSTYFRPVRASIGLPDDALSNEGQQERYLNH